MYILKSMILLLVWISWAQTIDFIIWSGLVGPPMYSLLFSAFYDEFLCGVMV